MQNYQSLPLEKWDIFHRMELFWKYSRKRLENPVSIVLSNSTVWKCFPWYGNILEMKLPYCGRGPVFTGITLSAEVIVEMLSCFAEFTCQPIQQLQHYI